MSAVSTGPHAMQSSCALTRIVLQGENGSERAVLLKDLSTRHRLPGFLHDDVREIDVYETILATAGLETAEFLGSDRGRRWLMIEDVDGVPLWQSEADGAWPAAAIWLARLHDLTPVPDGEHWLRYDHRYFAPWMERALRLAPNAELERLVDPHKRATAKLLAVRPEPVHGDYYPSNILIRNREPAAACPVDFELFGSGPGALDLAALITGLDEELAREVVAAYRKHRRSSIGAAELDELLLCARLHLAIRWLGWLEGWSAPAHQQFDWAAEAHAAADALEERR